MMIQEHIRYTYILKFNPSSIVNCTSQVINALLKVVRNPYARYGGIKKLRIVIKKMRNEGKKKNLIFSDQLYMPDTTEKKKDLLRLKLYSGRGS